MNEPKLQGALGRTHKPESPITLRDFLKDIECNVAIGSGSCFYYIGKAKDFLDEDYYYCDYYYTDQKVRMYYAAMTKWNAGQGTRKPVKQEHVPFLDRQVTEYYSRRVPDEPPMWCIITEGSEGGALWLLKETVPWLYGVKEKLMLKHRT